MGAILKYSSQVGVFVGTVLLVFMPSINAHAQDAQVWLEADGHKQLSKNWKYTGSPNFRTEATSQGWSRIGLKNTFSRKIRSWLAAEGGLDVFYTSDPVSADIGELRLMLGGKVTLPKFIHSIHLEKPYCDLKVEQRFLWYPEQDTDAQKERLRLKVGGTFILNNDKLVEKTYYMPWYGEGFHNFDGAAFEQNAAKYRFSLGIGYVINPKWRAEFEFIAQDSVDTLAHQFDRTDNIFQFKFQYYFDK